MKPAYQDGFVSIFQGDVREVLRELPDESVHCVVTSPPYWGLRDYGCPGQIGLEETPVKYVSVMREVFAEVRRVLRADGIMWLNMGDCYATGAGAVGECPGGGERGDKWKGYRGTRQSGKHEYISAAQGPMTQPNRMPLPGLKPKDLVGVPWMLAFALRDDGWYLRSDVIWHKPNPMPESVTDRPTKAHEYLFLMSKSERYRYDAEAIEEECQSGPSDIRKMIESKERIGGKHKTLVDPLSKASSTTNIGQKRAVGDPSGRNKRSVWNVATEPFPEAHFATFPQELIKPCILAGCPEGGTVLDPFMGSGTTGLVAKSLHCKAIGIELNPAYIDIAARRLNQDVFDFSRLDQEQTTCVPGRAPSGSNHGEW